jgi:predicted amidohydrolase
VTRVALVQMDIRIGAADANLDRTLSAMDVAAAKGARLVVLPECSLTGYCFSDPAEARTAALEPDGAWVRRLTAAAAAHDLTVVVGYLERREGGALANTLAVVDRNGVVAHYRKTHLPHLGADRYVTAGSAPFRPVLAAGLRLGLLICYDASFPEASRLLTLAGADLILLPTNWPEEAEAKGAWLPNARAYENVVYFASVNRVGEERGYRFHGMSRICDPTGATLAEAPRDAETVVVDVDPRRARQKKILRREDYWVDRIGQRREDLYRLSGEPPPKGSS